MKNDKLKAYLKDNSIVHEQPNKWSRRELLEIGAVPFALRMMIPSAASMLAQVLSSPEARAAVMVPMPIITVNLSGGAALHGNIIALNTSGGLLSSYNSLGMGLKTGTNGVEASRIDYLGLPFHENSFLYKGLHDVLGDGTSVVQNSKGISFCTITNNDTASVAPLRPPFDLSPAVESAGRMGQLFSDLQYFGNVANKEGTISIKSFKDEEPASRLAVDSLTQIKNSVALSGIFAEMPTKAGSTGKFDRFTAGQKNGLARFLSRLTASQAANKKPELAQATDQMQDLIGGTVSGADLVDPLKSAEAKTAFNLTGSSSAVDLAVSSVAYCALKGYSSHSLLVFGGYDYHQPNRSLSDNSDYSAGLQIGRILKLAELLMQPVFISVVTDGACSTSLSTAYGAPWVGDNSNSMQLAFAYHPNGVSSSGSQVGAYLDDQSVDATTLVGGRSDYVTAAILANYLSMNGTIDQFTKIAPATITSSRLNEVIRLSKKA